MPPETPVATNETPVAIQGNAPEARNPDGSMKDNLSQTFPTPKSAEPEKKPEPEKPGETKSTPPSSEKPSLLNQKEGEKTPDPAKTDEKKPESIATGAPEKYEFANLPEGVEVTDKALAFFKDNQMSQAQADKALSFYAELAKEAAQAPFKYWEDMNAGWVKDITADPEYKGNIENVKSTISKYVDQIVDAEGKPDIKLATAFREAMDLTGAGNNPAFVKFMFRMGLLHTEGSHVPAGGPSAFGQRAPGTGERPTAAHALYPSLK